MQLFDDKPSIPIVLLNALSFYRRMLERMVCEHGAHVDLTEERLQVGAEAMEHGS